MKEYYIERHGLIKSKVSLPLDDLIDYFIKTYKYFSDKEYFNYAIKGVWQSSSNSCIEKQVIPPSLAPTPDVFFTTRLMDVQVWPINEFALYYTEEILFTVIEILYDHIGTYNYSKNELNQDKPRKEFAEHINNILMLYNDGYYIEATNGFIMKLPNESLKEQLSYKGDEISSDIFEQLATASSTFYRFDSNMEDKRSAIFILASILEKEREGLKNLLNEEYDISKNKHDRLIFDIVNGFNIRHNRADQKEEYSKEIWYDWMMQYYTSVIIAFYKLKNKKEIERLF